MSLVINLESFICDRETSTPQSASHFHYLTIYNAYPLHSYHLYIMYLFHIFSLQTRRPLHKALNDDKVKDIRLFMPLPTPKGISFCASNSSILSLIYQSTLLSSSLLYHLGNITPTYSSMFKFHCLS